MFLSISLHLFGLFFAWIWAMQLDERDKNRFLIINRDGLFVYLSFFYRLRFIGKGLDQWNPLSKISKKESLFVLSSVVEIVSGECISPKITLNFGLISPEIEGKFPVHTCSIWTIGRGSFGEFSSSFNSTTGTISNRCRDISLDSCKQQW